jgi:uncharacterized protein (DUF488 family)
LITVYTIGHSTRTIEELIAVLRAHEIRLLVDIRAFPSSKRLPHFNRGAMEVSLAEARIEYRWKPEMGGRRGKPRPDSPNVGLRNDSFRAYADHMLTSEFQSAAREVLGWATEKKTTVMCAEKMWFQCHRMLVSDYFTAHGNEVRHIVDEKPTKVHSLMREAHVVDGELIYSAGRLF